MKKILIVLLLIFLTGCEYYEVDCEKYPGATVCQSGVVEKPIEVVEELIIVDCNETPGHAECITPFSELKSYSERLITLPTWGVHGDYPDGFFSTFTRIKVYISSDQDTYDIKSIAIREAEKFHRLSDKYNTYEGVTNVMTINNAPSEKHYLDKDLYDLIKFSIVNYEMSQGYFDISIGPVSSIWHDYRTDCKESLFHPAFCKLPEIDEINEASQYMGISRIILDDEEMSIQMSEGMSLDLGGVAKGYFVEKLADRLALEGVRAFMINSGGNVKTYGTKPNGENYSLGIQDPSRPRGEAALEHRLSLPGGYSAVSSGDQENYFIVDDVIYHHIINPFTKWPDRFSRQVTIVTNDSRAADIISTTAYAMSIEEGLEYVNQLENVEALWVSLDGEIFMSDGMTDFFE